MEILICDDHRILREGLRLLLQKLEGVTFIAEAANGNEVFIKLKEHGFDILILDISLPDMSGFDVLESVRKKWPSTNVLILSMHSQKQYVLRAFQLGASGYLTKDSAAEELLLAVVSISKNGKYISHLFAENKAKTHSKKTIKHPTELLSNREFNIMFKLAKGQSLTEIGEELFISNKTVSTYRSRIMKKMGLSKNTELTIYCIENNLL